MMFTLQQLKAAHAKVKSGSDFPAYIQEIKSLGLKRYIYKVTDGSTTYYGDSDHQVDAPGMYAPEPINPQTSPAELRHIIAIHQQGETDFLTFCKQAAAAGVQQWIIDTERMLCIYENSNGEEMIAEPIPQVGKA